MAGHSKWANIKHKKAKEDAKKGQVFTKISKEISVAAKQGGDPAMNPRLRLLIEKANAANMPKENVLRAIKKGTGELPGVNYEPMTYEGYGPGGIAILVETLTDNKNRTVAEMRTLFSRNGGNLGESGTVNWMFEKKGVIHAKNNNNKSEDELLEALIDFEIEDIKIEDGIAIITTSFDSLGQVRDTVAQLGLTIQEAELEWLPKNTMAVSEEDQDKAISFLETLDDHDDVQHVFTNME
ncbi:YebC/PmpR family DNA-binding transcriptional regulator [bacterium]|jgi:YebC/PmpR family DNA-binding regulatory protein|nr:YebC/PmpR family DNA-binding transcriptional regulator [bacterium]